MGGVVVDEPDRLADDRVVVGFLAYTVSVMPALRRMDDTTFVTVMKTIDVVIVNPLFLVVFLGAP